MFRNNKNKYSKKTYEAFDTWSKTRGKASRNIESVEQDQTKNSKDKPTIWRRMAGTKDYRELFPRPENSKPKENNNQQIPTSNSRGSISGTGVMGPEGSSGSNYSGVNPDLRRRLEEKKRQEAKAKRDMERADRKTSERDKKIMAQKKALKKKQDLRRAMITAEIVGPPKAKKFS